MVGLLFAALLVNGVSLYGTSGALARALESVAQDEPKDEVVEFDLVDPPPDDDTRFVDQDRANERRPEDSKRLGELDSDVERETQAPNRPDRRPSEPAKDSPKPDETEPPQGQREGGERGQERGENEGEGEGQDPGAGDDSLADADDGQTASEGADAGAKQGQADRLAKLGGSPSMLNDTFGRPGSDEILRDVDEGVESMLDSKRHLFASFFNRIRDRVSDQWRPNKVHNAVDPMHKKFGEKQRTTVLMVRLDAKGQILKVIVERKSGASHLDDEAVRAMRAAAPFLNPPEGLVNASGYIDFRFGFILDFNGGSKIFRYKN
ncbi:hypothetical protein ENSA5_08720 [Enhygromyxa salina]|uniref:TonB C-terminal domain-containing protein n=1 Tax=Enhygromyxa salina TaxID=215803 RepID=A0A2S9YH18_9BACT|nr:hypothetical protein ENSA5_08720 [Enhygromyxa salina]